MVCFSDRSFVVIFPGIGGHEGRWLDESSRKGVVQQGNWNQMERPLVAGAASLTCRSHFWQTAALPTEYGGVYFVTNLAQSNFALAPRAFGDESTN